MGAVKIVFASVAASAVWGSFGLVHKLKFGQDVDWPPYAFKDAEGNLQGFGKDIADGLTALCDDLEIEVVETKWNNCWSSSGGGSLGAELADGTLDACMTYTHAQGVRDTKADFSGAILQVDKAAGLIAKLDSNGVPMLSGDNDLNGKTVVDVGGWAPTADGLTYVNNKCTGAKYSTNYTLQVVDQSNDEALRFILNESADALFVYADTAVTYRDNIQCKENATAAAFDCDLWKGFGKTFAYVQTGQFGWTVNGTTLAITKKGSGVAEKINPCLSRFMQTKEYYDVCKKHGFEDDCYRNQFWSGAAGETKQYNKPTTDQTACSTGYCACPVMQFSAAHRHTVSAILALLTSMMILR